MPCRLYRSYNFSLGYWKLHVGNHTDSFQNVYTLYFVSFELSVIISLWQCRIEKMFRFVLWRVWFKFIILWNCTFINFIWFNCICFFFCLASKKSHLIAAYYFILTLNRWTHSCNFENRVSPYPLLSTAYKFRFWWFFQHEIVCLYRWLISSSNCCFNGIVLWYCGQTVWC